MKSFITSIAILGLVGMVAGVAVLANTTASISATVTPQTISVTVSPSSINYGVLDVNDVATSTEITATNNGNVTENLNIVGANSTNWTISTTSTGANQFMHEYATGTYSTWAALDNLPTYKTLASGVATSSTALFKLRFKMPSSTTSTSTQSTTVTVQATE